MDFICGIFICQFLSLYHNTLGFACTDKHQRLDQTPFALSENIILLMFMLVMLNINNKQYNEMCGYVRYAVLHIYHT